MTNNNASILDYENISKQGGEINIIINLKAVSIMLLLSAAIILPSVSSAFAIPSDGDKPGHTKLLAKSYGTKTKNLVCGEQLCSDSNEFPTLKGFKKEIVKTYKKIMEQYRAQKLLKILS